MHNRRAYSALTTLLILETAAIHGFLALQPDEPLRFLFLCNALGYIALLALLLTFSHAQDFLCVLSIAYTLSTICAWLLFGQPYDALGIGTKAIEVLLIGALLGKLYLNKMPTLSTYGW